MKKPDDMDEAEFNEIKKLIAEYRAREAAGEFEYPKRTYKEVQTWREAWIFIFYVAHLDHNCFLKSEDRKVKCVVWSVKQFNDKLVGVLEKIAERIGPDNDVTEIRLIETAVTSAGIEKLKKILPQASIQSFTSEQAKKDKKIEYINTEIEWIRKLQ